MLAGHIRTLGRSPRLRVPTYQARVLRPCRPSEAARVAGDIVSASDGLSLAIALDPDSLDAAAAPQSYCEEVLSEEYGRGYFDGWLDEPRAMETAEYRLGYRTGRDAGWRDEVPA